MKKLITFLHANYQQITLHLSHIINIHFIQWEL